MSDQKPTIVTRRSALRTGLMASIAAGLAGTVPAATVAAQAAPTVDLARGSDDAALAAWLAAWEREDRRLAAEHEAAFQAILRTLEAHVGHDAAWKLTDRLDTVVGLVWMLESRKTVEVVCAHLPGVAPAIRLALEHAEDTNPSDPVGCCSALTI